MIELIAKAVRHAHLSAKAYGLLNVVYHPKYMLQGGVKYLNSIHPNPNNSSVCGNNIVENPSYDLHIIIPMYNVERYIEECIDSILLQKTHYKYLVTVVNDGSTDTSMSILKKIRERSANRDY